MGLIVVLALSTTTHVFSASVSPPDAEVMSSCISATAPKAAKYVAKANDGVIFVLPSGEATVGLASDGQVRGELRGANWKTLSGLFDALRNRTSKDWAPPKRISVAGFRVEVDKPQEGWFGYEQLYFSFWPPGYSADMRSSVVRAFVGPTPHGATITCELSLRNGSWVVVNSWFTPYA